MQEVVLLCYLTCYHLGLLLAIANRGKTLSLDAVFNQIVDNTLGTTLAQFLVIFVLASEVAMRGKFNGDIRILVQQVHQTVQGLRAVFCKGSAIELIEHIADKHGVVDAGQWELQNKLLTDAVGVDMNMDYMPVSPEKVLWAIKGKSMEYNRPDVWVEESDPDCETLIHEVPYHDPVVKKNF